MIDPGMQTVRCRECGESGQLRVKRSASAKAHVEDFIPHAASCSLHVREQPRHLKQRDWRQQEKRANSLVGARATLASGAMNEDGDGRRFGEWRTESKQTIHPTYALTQAVWTKLVGGGIRAGEEALLHVQIAGASRVVVRQAWFEGQGGGATTDPLPKRGKTYHLSSEVETPHLVPLDPPGVMLYESEFIKLRGTDGYS